MKRHIATILRYLILVSILLLIFLAVSNPSKAKLGSSSSHVTANRTHQPFSRQNEGDQPESMAQRKMRMYDSGQQKEELKDIKYGKASSTSGTDSTVRRRAVKMREACSKFGLDQKGTEYPYKPNPWEYIVNREYGLVWCNVFKSASSSWMHIFNRLAGYKDSYLSRSKKSPLQLARDRYGRPNISFLQETMAEEKTISFLIGRDPFERLISGYKDKIQNALYGSPHDKLRRNITEKYRGIKIPVFAVARVKGRKPALKPEFVPTFQEFVRHVIDESRSGVEPDMHWAPVYQFCTPCQFRITDVLLLESLEEDTESVLRRAGVPPSIHMVKKNSSDKEKKGGEVKQGSTSDTITNYLAQLSESIYKDLIKIYEMDFHLFGYQIPDWSYIEASGDKTHMSL